MYKIDPEMSFHQVVACYEQYFAETTAQGKTPVTFLRFVTGRF